MKTPMIYLVLLMSYVVASCSEFKRESAAYAPEPLQDATQHQLAGTPVSDPYTNTKTKLIRTVNYRFEVVSVKTSTAAIEGAVKKFPAYISSSNLRLENPILENKITIRVQSEYFQDLLKEIDQQARFVNFRDVKTEDVAKQFVDLESRIATKREVEQRYMEILRKKAGTIEKLLKAEEQIGELHEEIEAAISRINFLKDEVNYSTLNLEFYQTITQEITAAPAINRKEQFIVALNAGWNGLMNTILALAYLWPFMILGGSALVAFNFWKRKKVNPA